MKTELTTKEGFVREVKEVGLNLVGVTPIFEHKEVQNIGILTRVFLSLSGYSGKDYYTYHTYLIGEAYAENEKEMKAIMEKLKTESDEVIKELKEANSRVRIIDGRVSP